MNDTAFEVKMDFIRHEKCGVVYMTAPNISVKHAFTTRYGGVSEGAFSSLNLNVSGKDDPAHIAENYRILCSALDIPLEKMVYTHQVHGTNILSVTEKDSVSIFDLSVDGCDGLITETPYLPIIAFTADCIPILLYDPVSGVVGAVHAGWRGTVADIAGKAVMKMMSGFGSDPKNIQCAIGPGIDKCCFETDGDVPDAVIDILGDDGKNYITENGRKYHVDLKGVNKALLVRRGVLAENIAVSDECTMCLHDKYWSNRYTHGDRGCQACVIMLGRTDNEKA